MHPTTSITYRGSPVSVIFQSPWNRTIGKSALIGDWFRTKKTILDFWIFKVHFSHFWAKNFGVILDPPTYPKIGHSLRKTEPGSNVALQSAHIAKFNEETVSNSSTLGNWMYSVEKRCHLFLRPTCFNRIRENPSLVGVATNNGSILTPLTYTFYTAFWYMWIKLNQWPLFECISE